MEKSIARRCLGPPVSLLHKFQLFSPLCPLRSHWCLPLSSFAYPEGDPFLSSPLVNSEALSTHLLAFPPRLQFPATVFMVTSSICPYRGEQGSPSSSFRMALHHPGSFPVVLQLSYALLSCFHCSKNLTPGRPLLSNPTFVHPPSLWLCWPSARPKLYSSAARSVFPLPPTPFPSIIRCDCGLPRAGLRTLAALVLAWPRKSCTPLKESERSERASSGSKGSLGSPSHMQGLCSSFSSSSLHVHTLQDAIVSILPSHTSGLPHLIPSCPFRPIQSNLPSSLNKFMVSGDLDGELRALPCLPLPCGEVDKRQLSMGTPHSCDLS